MSWAGSQVGGVVRRGGQVVGGSAKDAANREKNRRRRAAAAPRRTAPAAAPRPMPRVPNIGLPAWMASPAPVQAAGPAGGAIPRAVAGPGAMAAPANPNAWQAQAANEALLKFVLSHYRGAGLQQNVYSRLLANEFTPTPAQQGLRPFLGSLRQFS